ncbi:protein of unknown function [Ralstonia solanacearum CMR15]|nr:protein of unknown function [Ralstonia solanacearum CMR15]
MPEKDAMNCVLFAWDLANVADTFGKRRIRIRHASGTGHAVCSYTLVCIDCVKSTSGKDERFRADD